MPGAQTCTHIGKLGPPDVEAERGRSQVCPGADPTSRARTPTQVRPGPTSPLRPRNDFCGLHKGRGHRVGEKCPRRSTQAEAGAQRLNISPLRHHPQLALLTPAPTPDGSRPASSRGGCKCPYTLGTVKERHAGLADLPSTWQSQSQPLCNPSVRRPARPSHRPSRDGLSPHQAGPSSGPELTAHCHPPSRVLPLGAPGHPERWQLNTGPRVNSLLPSPTPCPSRRPKAARRHDSSLSQRSQVT